MSEVPPIDFGNRTMDIKEFRERGYLQELNRRFLHPLGLAYYGQQRCTCWEPVYDVEQAPPSPVTDVSQLDARPRMCGDCAYRRDSPERAEAFTEDHLLALPANGDPFWCHEGMRRPTHYRHPALGDIPADPADWRPPIVDGIPHRADGRPGLLCAGWTARRLSLTTDRTDPTR